MALPSDKLTVSYSQIMAIPIQSRTKLAANGLADIMARALTPGQRASLFPSYYREAALGATGSVGSLTESGFLGGSNNDPPSGYNHNTTPSVKRDAAKAGIPFQPGAGPSSVDMALVNAERGASSALTDKKGRVVSTYDTSLKPYQRALLDTIAMGNATSGGHYWESPDYNTIVGNGGKFTDYSDHPRKYGTPDSTAAGRYQFTKTTWDLVRDEYNKLHPDNPILDFSPRNQDRAALYLAEDDYKRRTGRDLTADLLSGNGTYIKEGLGGQGTKTTWQVFQMKTEDEVAQAFEANLKRNAGYTDGNTATATPLTAAEEAWNKLGYDKIAAAAALNSTPVPGADAIFVSPVTGTFAGNSSNVYGASRGGGIRDHSGVDLNAPEGQMSVFPVSGKVITSGYNDGYENNTTILGNDGRIYRLAYHGEHAKNFKVGEEIQQGQPAGKISGAAGGNPHMHFEIIPKDLNGKPNPVYDKFLNVLEEHTGEYPQTESHGWGHINTSDQRGTINPADELGLEYGDKLTQGEISGTTAIAAAETLKSIESAEPTAVASSDTYSVDLEKAIPLIRETEGFKKATTMYGVQIPLTDQQILDKLKADPTAFSDELAKSGATYDPKTGTVKIDKTNENFKQEKLDEMVSQGIMTPMPAVQPVESPQATATASASVVNPVAPAGSTIASPASAPAESVNPSPSPPPLPKDIGSEIGQSAADRTQTAQTHFTTAIQTDSNWNHYTKLRVENSVTQYV